MTHRDLFVAGVDRLKAASVPSTTPDLDARVLLGFAAGLGSASLFARWSETPAAGVADRFQDALDRRLLGEPVAWITGTQEFYGLAFEVGPGLLVPRADTETLVDAALEVWPPGPDIRVADVCTGTGCVAVALAAHAGVPAEVWACDLDPRAVETASKNARNLLPPARAVTVVASDLLESLPGPWHLIVSNPPYLTPEETSERLGPGGWREPSLALDGGGDDGLDLIRRLVGQASERLVPGGWLLLEAGGPQSPAIVELLTQKGFAETRVWTDLAGFARVTGGMRN